MLSTSTGSVPSYSRMGYSCVRPPSTKDAETILMLHKRTRRQYRAGRDPLWPCKKQRERRHPTLGDRPRNSENSKANRIETMSATPPPHGQLRVTLIPQYRHAPGYFRMRGVGGGVGGASPPGSPLAGSPVTRNAEIDPPPLPKMTPGGNDPPNPPSSPSTASLSGVARCWHSNAYFSLFSSLFFFDPPNRFVQIPRDLS